MNPSQSRVALVTGGTGGIGRAVVDRLAADGYAVAVHYAGNRAAADTVVAAITEAGGRAVAVGGDVGDDVAMAAAFDAVEAALGGLDVVVNTAGIMILGPIATFDLDALDRMHRTNIRGAFVVSRLAADRLRPGGALIHFSTSQTRGQLPTYGPYVASKAAVEGLTLILARELRGRDITVNAVAPGPVATSLFLDGKDEETGRALRPHGAPRPPRRARRRRRGGRLPRRARPLGQRSGAVHQRRSDLTGVDGPVPTSGSGGRTPSSTGATA